MSYSYVNFLEFCRDSGSSIRVDDGVVWVKTKPLPAVLVRRMFYSADTYLALYSKHLLAGVILALKDIQDGRAGSFFKLFPSQTDAAKYDSVLSDAWGYAQTLKVYKEFEFKVTQTVCIKSFELSRSDLKQVLQHTGKKYERLYLPDLIKHLFVGLEKTRDNLLGRNGDFFGNVIADNLNVYKTSVGDAFSTFFNRYLDYKLGSYIEVDPRNAVHGEIVSGARHKLGELIPLDYVSGGYWNPRLLQGGLIGAEVDVGHPFYSLADEKKYGLLLLALSEEEMLVFNEEQKRTIEEFRFRTSKRMQDYSELMGDQ